MTLQDKQFLLAELKEICREVKLCREMLEDIKRELPAPAKARRAPNLHPSNMKLPQPFTSQEVLQGSTEVENAL